jgi:hypothetical protein
MGFTIWFPGLVSARRTAPQSRYLRILRPGTALVSGRVSGSYWTARKYSPPAITAQNMPVSVRNLKTLGILCLLATAAMTFPSGANATAAAQPLLPRQSGPVGIGIAEFAGFGQEGGHIKRPSGVAILWFEVHKAFDERRRKYPE